MQVKKNENANLEKRKGAYFAIGLLFVLAVIFCLFEFRFYEFESSEFKTLHLDLIEAEVIPISHQTPPPPPPPPQSITQIEIVSDNEVIEIQFEIEDLEIDDDSKIAEVREVLEELPEEMFEEEEIFTIVEKMPEFPGGVDALFSYLGSNIDYPAMARDARIQGKVYITFVVDSNGGITGVKVLRGIGGGCDEEAIRVVKGMPKWAPGRQRGKAVRVQYNLPINFILQ